MGILQDMLLGNMESKIRAKEAKGETAGFDRGMLNYLKRANDEQTYQGRSRERIEYIEEADVSLDPSPDPSVTKIDSDPLDRLRENVKEKEGEVNRLQKMWWWFDQDRLDYLSQTYKWLLSVYHGHPHIVSRVLSAHGNENINRDSIEFYCQVLEQYGFGGGRLPRPLTPSYIRNWIRTVPELKDQPMTEALVRNWVMSILPELTSQPDKSTLSTKDIASDLAESESFIQKKTENDSAFIIDLNAEKKRGIGWKLAKYLIVYPVICVAIILLLAALMP